MSKDFLALVVESTVPRSIPLRMFCPVDTPMLYVIMVITITPMPDINCCHRQVQLRARRLATLLRSRASRRVLANGRRGEALDELLLVSGPHRDAIRTYLPPPQPSASPLFPRLHALRQPCQGLPA